MNRAEYLLTCLQEECGEVTQAASKIKRFTAAETGPGQTLSNAELLVVELVDILAIVELLEKEGVIALPPLEKIHEMVLRKQEKLEKFMGYSRLVGTLQDREDKRHAA